jgi:hypothetical protein
MKTLLCSLISICGFSYAWAGTAYDALRVIEKARGGAVMDRVIEVRGAKGAPQPRTWKVVVLDDGTPNGVREFDVQGTTIAAERTPQAIGGGEPMNMSQLNLDSDGAHTVAEREAKKNGFAYDHVSYLLHGGARGGAPTWEIRLADEQNGNVAVLTMGAESGKLLNSSGLNRGSAPVPKVAENRRANREDEEMSPEEEEELARLEDRRRIEVRRVERDDEEVEVDRFGNRVTRFADRAGRHIGGAFQRFGDKLNRVFGGSPAPRRVERRVTPPPSKSRRDANGTEYYRPRD